MAAPHPEPSCASHARAEPAASADAGRTERAHEDGGTGGHIEHADITCAASAVAAALALAACGSGSGSAAHGGHDSASTGLTASAPASPGATTPPTSPSRRG
ncbi:hypothetical protein ACLB9X_19430 [Streptomyces sp. 5K101]|uniref:hypothetical protein n=1 Tax=Streptomyces sp. 5K101 TaxID=3390037 RepID=UPI00397655E8